MQDQTLQRVEELEKRVQALEAKLTQSFEQTPTTCKKQISLREFLLEKVPKDDVKKTVIIGYYLEQFEGNLSFNIKDLERGFERAREKKPLNMNDKVNMAIRHGYFDEMPEKKENKKAWHLTNTGLSVVDNGLQK